MVYKFWEWYDKNEKFEFLLFVLLVAPFLIGISYETGSIPMLVGLGWTFLLVITRMYYALRKLMDEETRREYGTRHSRK